MKKLIFGALAVLSLTACSNDEQVIEQIDSNAIKFNASAQSSSRATDVYCNALMPASFTINAAIADGTTKGNMYISGATINRVDNTDAYKFPAGETYYWPAAGLNFFGFANDDNKFSMGTKSADDTYTPTFTAFSPAATVANQKDLLYAVVMGQTKAASNAGAVNINFRHALSQIVFRAKNKNEHLYVEIKEVGVHNLKGTGTYTFPLNTTTANVAHPENTTEIDSAGQWTINLDNTHGTWALTGDANAAYKTGVKGTNGSGSYGPTITYSADGTTITNLTMGQDGTTGTFNEAMLLLPQAGEALNLAAQDGGTASNNGVYFTVKCKIWNVAGTTFNADTDELLFDSDADSNTNKDGIRIPVKIDWKEGHKYIYTFVFGDGNGGWDPDDPDPVLVPISFTVTVDEFIPVNGGEYNMWTGTTTPTTGD